MHGKAYFVFHVNRIILVVGNEVPFNVVLKEAVFVGVKLDKAHFGTYLQGCVEHDLSSKEAILTRPMLLHGNYSLLRGEDVTSPNYVVLNTSLTAP